MSAARVRRVGWRSFRPLLAPSATAAGPRPPCAQTKKKRFGYFGTRIFVGERGDQNTSNNSKPHAKNKVPNQTQGGRCGSQSGGALPAFRPFSRPLNIGQTGNLWHCKFMGWRSTDQQKIAFGLVPVCPVPIVAIHLNFGVPWAHFRVSWR